MHLRALGAACYSRPIPMAPATLGVSHDRREETIEAKAEWFRSLTLAERMDLLCAITDLALTANPLLGHQRHAQSTSGRVRVLEQV